MNYLVFALRAEEPTQAEIWLAELAELPFESFEQEGSLLKAYIPEDIYSRHREEIDNTLNWTNTEWSCQIIAQQNWNQLWESQFEPIRIADRCMVRAPFHYPDPAAELDLIIMPKMSFGTGHHATTRLVLTLLLDLKLSGLHGLDMGSGTGVLAIAAAKLGSVRVDAVDIDEWAYENGVENVAANGVEHIVKPLLGDIDAVAGRSYDFILANINRNILLRDMKHYAKLLTRSGILILSGILTQDEPAIARSTAQEGFKQVKILESEGWISMSFVK